MNTDFRVSTGWLDHPKTQRLIARCGRDGAFSLLALWSWSALVMPTGKLGDITDAEVEKAARWEGEAGALAAALFDLGWLDRAPDGVRIHDWPKHNGYAAGASIRMRSAQHAANERWRNDSKRKKLMRAHMPLPTLPAPAPSISSTSTEETHSPAVAGVVVSGSGKNGNGVSKEDLRTAFDALVSWTPNPGAWKCGGKREARIRGLVHDYGLESVVRVGHWVRDSRDERADFLRKRNDVDTLTWRDKFETYAAMSQNGGGPSRPPVPHHNCTDCLDTGKVGPGGETEDFCGCPKGHGMMVRAGKGYRV